jgi:SAM-dependent methyltransferase
MRRALVEQLRCPLSGEKFILHVEEENAQEVRQGELRTESGTHRYRIIDGVAELLPMSELDRDTLREREVRDEKRRDWSVERQRPYLNDNKAEPWIWPAFAANVEQGLAQLDLRGCFVLDIGCATAWSTRMMVERGAQAVALDISTGILRDAEAQFATGVYFDRIAATMTQIPTADAVFDVVFASAAVHHASDLAQTFREFARVLKPGGTLVLVSEPVHGVLRAGQKFGEVDIEAGMNEHVYSLSAYQQAAQSVGFVSRILFPADLQNQLAGNSLMPPSLPIRMLKTLWPVLKPFQNLLLLPGHWLIGLSMTMIARKQSN